MLGRPAAQVLQTGVVERCAAENAAHRDGRSEGDRPRYHPRGEEPIFRFSLGELLWGLFRLRGSNGCI